MPGEVPWQQPYSEHPRLMAGVAALAFVLALAVGATAFFATFIWPSGVASDTRVYAGRIGDFAVDAPVYFEEQQFFLVRRSDGTFIALYAINAHGVPNECPVQWITDISIFGWAEEVGFLGAFRAPCHGETFDISGRRIFGPSPRDLDRFPVIIQGDKVYVDAGLHDRIKVNSDPR